MKSWLSNRNWPFVLIAILVLWIVWMGWQKYRPHQSNVAYGPEAVIENYGREIVEFGEIYQIPPEYLAALCMLESGGRKPTPSRFERHVFQKLKLVQAGMKSQYEHVTKVHLEDAGIAALENLASSWGPFQIMGYKVLLFDIEIKDLRGDAAVYWACKWIDTTYGSYVRNGDFRNAFHIHNTGAPIPKNGRIKTHDPEYISNGMYWVGYFRKYFTPVRPREGI